MEMRDPTRSKMGNKANGSSGGQGSVLVTIHIYQEELAGLRCHVAAVFFAASLHHGVEFALAAKLNYSLFGMAKAKAEAEAGTRNCPNKNSVKARASKGSAHDKHGKCLPLHHPSHLHLVNRSR